MPDDRVVYEVDDLYETELSKHLFEHLLKGKINKKGKVYAISTRFNLNDKIE